MKHKTIKNLKYISLGIIFIFVIGFVKILSIHSGNIVPNVSVLKDKQVMNTSIANVSASVANAASPSNNNSAGSLTPICADKFGTIIFCPTIVAPVTLPVPTISQEDSVLDCKTITGPKDGDNYCLTPGSIRTQVFKVSGNIKAGDRFFVSYNGHKEFITAVLGDTPSSVAAKLIKIINSTSFSSWLLSINSAYPIQYTAPLASSYGANSREPNLDNPRFAVKTTIRYWFESNNDSEREMNAGVILVK
jgi:hypothetical protein